MVNIVKPPEAPVATATAIDAAAADDVHVRLAATDVLPRAPLLVRPQPSNFVIAQAYEAHAQQADSVTAKAEKTAAKPRKLRVSAFDEAPTTAAPKKSPLKAKPAADEFDQAFILHAYPYKETSLILETFTRKHGRVAMVARGAKRPHGALTSARSPFQPLNLVWMGKGDLKTLKTAESGAIFPQLQGTALLSAFYLNELLLKLCAKEDPQPALFDAYQATLQRLIEVHYRARLAAQQSPGAGLIHTAIASGEAAAENFANYAAQLKLLKRAARAGQMQQIAITLRQFELNLFQQLGYGLNLEIAADTGLPLVAENEYCYLPNHGAVTLGADDADKNLATAAPSKPRHGLQLRGKTLLDIAQANYDDPTTQQQSKQLVRLIINHLLGSQVLHTRSLITEFAELK